MAKMFNVSNSGAANTEQPKVNNPTPQPTPPIADQELNLPQAPRADLGHEPQVVSELNLPRAPKVNGDGGASNGPISGSGTRPLPKLDDIMGANKQAPVPDIAGLTSPGVNNDSAFAEPVSQVNPAAAPQVQQQASEAHTQQPINQQYQQQQMQPVQQYNNYDPTMGMAEAYMQEQDEQENDEEKPKINKMTIILISVVVAIGVAFAVVFIMFGGLGGASNDENSEQTAQESELVKNVLDEDAYKAKIKELDDSMAKVLQTNSGKVSNLDKDSAKSMATQYKNNKEAIDKSVEELNKYEAPEKYKDTNEAYIKMLKDISAVEDTLYNTYNDYSNNKIDETALVEKSGEAFTKYMSAMQKFGETLNASDAKDVYPSSAFNLSTSG